MRRLSLEQLITLAKIRQLIVGESECKPRPRKFSLLNTKHLTSIASFVIISPVLQLRNQSHKSQSEQSQDVGSGRRSLESRAGEVDP